MYDRKYEEKTKKSGLRVSKSCRKTRNSNRILMFTEKLNKKRRRKIFFLIRLMSLPAAALSLKMSWSFPSSTVELGNKELFGCPKIVP